MDTKTIYLIRHGDARQGLTPLGIEQIQATARQLQTELAGLEKITIYHSPLQRAAESAQVMLETLKPVQATLQARKELCCDSLTVAAVVKTAESPCIIVSHQPDLQHYLRQLGKFERMSNGKCVKVQIDCPPPVKYTAEHH